MLRVKCPHCGRSAKASEEFAGRNFKCRRCGKVVRLPKANPRETSATDVPVVSRFAIKRTFLGKYVALYLCPHCGGQLRSDEREIHQAGEDSCPECNRSFRVSADAIQGIDSRRKEDEARKRVEQERRQDLKREKQRAKTLAIEQRAIELKKQNDQAARDLATIAAEKNVADRQSGAGDAVLIQHPVQFPVHFADARPCPFCGEEIKSSAVKCRHCGEFLDPTLREERLDRPGPAVTTVVNVSQPVQPQPRWSPVTAALLSLLVPGLGQVYKGQPLNGLCWFVLTLVGYALLIVPGLILHFCCILGATMGDPYR